MLELSDLPEGWDCKPLATLVKPERGISYGIVQPGRHDADGVRIVRVNNIRDGRIKTDEVLTVAKELEAKYSRTRLVGGEVLLTLVGTLGECAVVPSDLSGWNVARAVGVIPVEPPIDPRWIAICLRSAPLQHLIRTWATTTVQATLNLRDVARLPIPLPPQAIRDAITEMLSKLDEKIDLNRRMNTTLEATARALFQAWFVDFEPVRAKGAGVEPFGFSRDVTYLFPDSFEKSVIGTVPKGWQVCAIGDIAQRVAMGPFGSNIKTDNFVPEGVPVIRGGNLTTGFVDEEFVFLTDDKADELKNSNAYPGDIVITHRGTLGQVGLIPRASRFKRYVVSQSQMLIRGDAERLPPHYLYMFLTSSSGQHALLANRSQTGVPAIAQPTASVKAIKLICPPPPLLRRFEELAVVIFDSITSNNQQCRTLAAIRNALLPKLMSGEVRVRP